ncbi:phosphotransferase [Paenibacillus sp. LMG 31456]|uniref:Phosphotransferase n=2 Tax=Paenibacillus foliorum TaxID=2654974 RepID=A0A972K0H5_9BACL|nr:phosphotransferase [Paenibacillus foliorum]
MIPQSEHTPPDRVLKWVVNSVDPLAAVQSTRRLQGGISSIIHSVSLRTHGEVREFVVRQFDNEEWLKDEPDLALHEAESLRWAYGNGLCAPQIIAFNESGRECGVPTVLMTRLEGSVVLNPANYDLWLNGLAESLVKIHAVEADSFPWAYFTYNDIDTLEIPSWSSSPELWSRVLDIVRGPKPKFKPCFIHRDYHPTNVLWTGNYVSGVVDWVNACRGPAGIDIGHCRLNLAMLLGVQSADQFLSAYLSHAGTEFSYSPYWDILSLVDILFGPPTVYQGWTALGVTGLTDTLMVERIDRYMASLVERVSSHSDDMNHK